MSQIKVKLVRSTICCKPAQRKTLEAMGFTKREMVVTMNDNAASRGMIARVVHLVEVLES